MSPSLQIREENLRKALINGFSACDRGNGEIAVAFRPDFFVEYVQNLENLHGIGDSPHTVEIFEEVAEGKLEVNTEVLREVTQLRQIALETISKKLRDNSFKKRVLNAYGQRCAFSGMQLKLVDAAHIVPVSEAYSTDETCNGIALSALYHRAYDKGLVTFNENYQVIVNENALKSFKLEGLDGGIEHFQQMLRPVIVVPPSLQDRPNLAYLEKANKLRGWI